MGQPLRRLPPAETLSYLLLTMTAISGEFPVSQVRRLPGGAAYMLSVVTALKRDGLLKTYSETACGVFAFPSRPNGFCWLTAPNGSHPA